MATIFLFRSVIFEGMTFLSPDSSAPLGFVKVGEATLYGEGVYPLWNPYVFSGMPSFASLAYNPLIYPPDWPLALVQKVLPPDQEHWTEKNADLAEQTPCILKDEGRPPAMPGAEARKKELGF